MPKRNVASCTGKAVAADVCSGRRNKAARRKKAKKMKSSSKDTKSSSALHAVVTGFTRGLSHQIPPHSLSNIFNSSDSIRLLLEKSTESLPMGSTIRKAVGENFDSCMKLLTNEIELRLSEQRALAEPSEVTKSTEQEKNEEPAAASKIAVFSRTQYEHALQKLRSMSDEEEAEDYRKLLASTDFATADVMFPFSQTKPSAEAVLEAFRSASSSGRMSELTVGGYVTHMIAALRDEIRCDLKHAVALIREFMGCFVVAGCAMNSALMSNNGKAALEYGEILGMLLYAAMTRPTDYLVTPDDKSSNSDDSSSDSDIEDDSGPRERQNKDQAQARAMQDIKCNLMLFTLGIDSAVPYIVSGILQCVNERVSTSPSKNTSEALLQKACVVLIDTLARSAVPKNALPSKLVRSASEKIRMIQRWADGEIEGARRARDAAVEGEKANIAVNKGERDVACTHSSNDYNDSSEESNDERSVDEEIEHDAAQQAAADDSLFVIDTAPVDDDGAIGGGDNDDKQVEDEEDEKHVTSVKDLVTEGKHRRPPRPPGGSRQPKAADAASAPASAPSPSCSTRPRSRGDSVASVASTDAPLTTPRRSTRSRSRGESINSLGSTDVPPSSGTRRSTRIRSRGDSMS